MPGRELVPESRHTGSEVRDQEVIDEGLLRGRKESGESG